MDGAEMSFNSRWYSVSVLFHSFVSVCKYNLHTHTQRTKGYHSASAIRIALSFMVHFRVKGKYWLSDSSIDSEINSRIGSDYFLRERVFHWKLQERDIYCNLYYTWKAIMTFLLKKRGLLLQWTGSKIYVKMLRWDFWNFTKQYN